MKPLLRPLALAVGLLSITAYANDTQTASQNFSQVIIFGDSLSDTGRIKATVGEVAPAFADKLQPSFTTNPDPVWASILAGYYGKTAKPFTKADPNGTNFAVGGARSGEEVNWNGVITVPSTNTQIKEHLTNTGGKADPNALYAVWIGSNDLIAAANATTTADAQKAIANAVGRTVVDIATLNQAGASVILVPNVPDLSLTPRAIFGETLQAGVQQKAKLAATLYNQGLYTALNNVNANIIPANTFALLQEAVANKDAFGFKNTSGVACQMPPRTTGADDPASTSLGCTRANLIESNANESYAFADDIHPSGKTHRILAQYYHSLIDSPSQMGQLTAQVAKHDTHRLYQKLTTLDSHTHSVWADFGKTGDTTNTLVGLDMAGQNHHTGVYVSHQTSEHKLNALNADTKATGVGVYHKHNVGQVQVTANAGVDKLTLNTDRQVAWDGMPRNHTASTAGTRYFAGANVSYGIDFQGLNVRPSLGVTAQQVQINDIIENNAQLSTALQYKLPNVKSVQGVAGVDAHYALNDKVDLTASLAHYHEFKDTQDLTVNAKLSSMPEYGKSYALPMTLKQDHAQKADVGAVVKLGKATLNAGLTATHTDGDSDVGGYAGVQMKF